MAVEARWAVTQPYHGPAGELVYDVGHEFPLDAELPYGVAVHVTAVEVPGKPAEEKPAETLPPPAKPLPPGKGKP